MPRAHARTARSARRHSRVLGVAQSCLAPIDAKVYHGHSLLPESREPVHDVVARASGARPAPDADGKTNEITRFEPLLEDLDLAGCVITADALHTERETAEFVVTTKNAHYILIVKKEPARPVRHDQEPALGGHPGRPQPAEPRPRPAGAPRPENRRRRRRAAVPARGQGHPHHPPRPADLRHREVEDLHHPPAYSGWVSGVVV